MKKALSLTALTLASLLAMAGCANPVDDANGNASDAPAVQAPTYKADPDLVAMLPKELQNGGEIKVGVNPDVPPIKYTDSSGKMTGVAPQLVEAAASMLGITAKMELTTFDALIPGLESGRIDVVASIGDFKERQVQADFIDYLNAGTSILAAKSYKVDDATLMDLCGTRIGYIKGTQQQGLVEAASKECGASNKEPIEGTSYADAGTSILAVKSGQADGTWIDSPAVLYNVTNQPETFKSIYTAKKPIMYGIGFSKEDTDLQKAIRAALLKMADSGDYQKLLEGYGLGELSLPTMPINGGGPANG